MITTRKTNETNDVAAKSAMPLHGNIRAPEKYHGKINPYISNNPYISTHQSAHPAIIKENL